MIKLALVLVFVAPVFVLAAPATTDTLATAEGPLVVHALEHASFLLQWNGQVVAVDPVGDVEAYMSLGRPDLVLVTHKHADHFDADVLQELAAQNNVVITNMDVAESVPACDPVALGYGEHVQLGSLTVTAMPAYNLSQDRLAYHPQGRDNAYLLEFGDFRVFISGDTEDIPEHATLAPLDAAFLCMNRPWTMSVKQAASAVAAMQPRVLYPYHYRHGDGSLTDLEQLSRLVGAAVDVRVLAWY